MKDQFTEFARNVFFSETFIHAFYCDQKRSKYHNHNFFELVYVVKGKGLHKLDTDVREIKPGDYMFMDYSTFHEYEGLTDDFCIINCLFLSKGIDKTMPDCHDFNELLKSYHLRLNKVILKETPVNRFFHDNNGKIGMLLDEMCTECAEKNSGYVDYLRSLLIQIIIQTVRNISVGVEINYSEPVFKAVKLIEEHFAEKLQLSDIASRMFISVPYLSSRFKDETGVCFSDYLKQTRIQKACMMLNTTNLKIHSIAEKVGYSDYKRFGSVFREITGTSPGKFRSQAKV